MRSALFISDQEVAVKTGTTNSLRDNWTIGYTRDRVVLTWVGNNDNSPMSSVASGVTGASPIWNKVMSRALSEDFHRFALPAGLERVRLCAITGTLACASCPRVIEEVLPLERIPKRACAPGDFAQASPTPAPVAQR
jgi:membrane carboxypeptidase/penicillin-binding protein PbpC